MVIFDVDLLPALAAGPVRRFRINHLYQLSQHTRGDFLDVHVFFCRLQLELLFHYEDDMLTVSENIPLINRMCLCTFAVGSSPASRTKQ